MVNASGDSRNVEKEARFINSFSLQTCKNLALPLILSFQRDSSEKVRYLAACLLKQLLPLGFDTWSNNASLYGVATRERLCFLVATLFIPRLFKFLGIETNY